MRLVFRGIVSTYCIQGTCPLSQVDFSISNDISRYTWKTNHYRSNKTEIFD